MSTAHRVSVCIPARNSAAYLAPAIDSVIAQRYEDFELVVCDNASTDETAEICAGYSDPRFRVVRFDQMVGQAENWNRCLALASGEYVILLHADDELDPRFLARAVEMLDSDERIQLVHCTARHIDEQGRPLSEQRLLEGDLVDRDDLILRSLLLEGCVINPAGVIARRDAYETVGEFTDRVLWGVDWHMWIRIAMRGPVGYLADPLSVYREHTASGTSGVMKSGRNAADERWVTEDVFRIIEQQRPDLLGLRDQALRGVAERTWWHAELMCQAGEMGPARAGLRNAIRMRPALAAKPRTWALLAATYLGYDSFKRARGWKRRHSASGELQP